MSLDSPRKRKVREEWNTPLIAHLAHEHRIRFHYFGFPGIEARDIVLWKDYIETVTAFEAPDDPSSGRGESNAAKVEQKLIDLGFEPQCYVGYLENIIETGVDNRGRSYIPDKFYTLINLDFCNHLTSRTLVDQVLTTARYDTFRRIAAIQREKWDLKTISGSLWLVTLRQEMHLGEYRRWRNSLDDVYLARWVDRYQTQDIGVGRGLFKNPFKLKAFLYKVIKSALDGICFSSYWYPMVLYEGHTPMSPMVHFMILSHANSIGHAAPVCLQTTGNFLNSKIRVFTNDDVRFYESDFLCSNSNSFTTSVLRGLNFPFVNPI